MRIALIVVMGLLIGLGGPVASLATSRPLSGEPVVVVMRPGADRAALVAAAGGRLIGPGSAPLGALALSPADDFPERLRAAGALMVLDGRLLAALCGAGAR